jgi:hypothetical protein
MTTLMFTFLLTALLVGMGLAVVLGLTPDTRDTRFSVGRMLDGRDPRTLG